MRTSGQRVRVGKRFARLCVVVQPYRSSLPVRVLSPLNPLVAEKDTATVTVLKPASVVSTEKTTGEVFKLPDLLYAGLQALDADRLLTPENNNAFSIFRARSQWIPIMRLQERALLRSSRAISRSREAIGNGSFDSAELMIQRAKLVDATVAEIALCAGRIG